MDFTDAELEYLKDPLYYDSLTDDELVYLMWAGGTECGKHFDPTDLGEKPVEEPAPATTRTSAEANVEPALKKPRKE